MLLQVPADPRRTRLGRDRVTGVLELRPNCECCDVDLSPADEDVWICTFECTWCGPCARDVLGMICPNCDGELARRPRRPVAALAANPPSQVRVFNPDCQSGPVASLS
jgi:hypothetical protein